MGEFKRKPITIVEIAAHAGVTAQTVSYVLSNNQVVKISVATRERIQRIAKELGYRPNRLAQAMKSGRSMMVSAWLPFSSCPEEHMMLGDLATVAANHHFDVIVRNASIESELSWPYEGIFAINAYEPLASYLKAEGSDLPAVCIGSGTPGDKLDIVTADHVGAAKSIGEAFRSQGCEHGVLCTARSGTHGLAAALKAECASLDFSEVALGTPKLENFQLIKSQLNSQRPTAIFCDNQASATELNWFLQSEFESGKHYFMASLCAAQPDSNHVPKGLYLVNPSSKLCEVGWELLFQRMNGLNAPGTVKTVPFETLRV